jgi:hypothetical protein
MAKDVRRDTEPMDRMSRIADAMLETLKQHPENHHDRIQSIVLLLDPATKEATSALRDLDAADAMGILLQHAEAIAKAHDLSFAVITTDAIGGQG